MSLDENDQMQHRLFSIGKDRKCFEYNVATSRIDTKLSVEREFTIDTICLDWRSSWGFVVLGLAWITFCKKTLDTNQDLESRPHVRIQLLLYTTE